MLQKKYLLGIGIAVCLLLLGAGIYYLKVNSLRIVVPTSKVQSILNEKLPIKKSMIVISVTVLNPRVSIASEGNRLSLGLDVDASILGKSYLGSVDMLTDVSYNKSKGQITLLEPEIKSVSIPELPDDKLKIIQGAINQIAKSLINGIPVYTIEPTDAKLYAAKHLLKGINIERAGIVVELGLD